jgi:hypothetical protein
MGGGEGKGEEERRDVKMWRCPKVKMLMERTKVVVVVEVEGGGVVRKTRRDETRREVRGKRTHRRKSGQWFPPKLPQPTALREGEPLQKGKTPVRPDDGGLRNERRGMGWWLVAGGWWLVTGGW